MEESAIDIITLSWMDYIELQYIYDNYSSMNIIKFTKNGVNYEFLREYLKYVLEYLETKFEKK